MQKEFTFSAVFMGIIIGVVMTAANVYLGLYAGMTVSASIPAAVLALGFYKMLFKESSIYQVNIVQTMASAGESLAAGVIFTLPALVLVGAWSDFDFWTTTLIAMAGGVLGVIFMIPLRKTLIQNEKELTYPEGVACAAVLESGADSQDKSGFFVILKGLVLGGVFKFLGGGLGIIAGSVEIAKKFAGSSLFFGFDVSPALLAVGYIVKLEIAILVFIGGAIGFFIGIPLLGTPYGFEDKSALDLTWTLWSTQIRYVGVGAMVVGGMWSIVSVRRGILKGLKGISQMSTVSENIEKEEQDLPLWALLFILSMAFMLMFYIYFQMIGSMGLTLLTAAIMLVSSFVFVAVSSYIVGLVGSSNNPVSGMTISVLLATSAFFLALGFTGDSAILTTLGVAAVVCCAACTAGDCSQDLKTGFLIKATPKYQQMAQLIGVLIPAFCIAPVLSLLHSAYGIGEGLKAPQASLFASITRALFGEGQLPVKMVAYGAVLGLFIIVLDTFFFRGKKFRLHIMPIAVGIYLPVTLAIPILFGGIIHRVFSHSDAEGIESKDKGVLLSSGFIAGEAVMGVLVAMIIYFAGDALKLTISPLMKEIFSVVAFAFIASYLIKVIRNK